MAATRQLALHARGRQAGVVLFIALIVLVAMSLAGLAIMRSVGSGVLVASNLAFKQTTTAGAERGVEEAKAWLLDQSGNSLHNDSPSKGYYSSWGTFDPMTFDWSNDANVAQLAADNAGTKIRYVIHRLCLKPNDSLNASGQQCVMKAVSTATASGGSAAGVQYGSFNLKSTISPYYRVTVRSEGPKNAVSYVQVIFD
jgi:Tfp pilus assembly protein PilX